MAQAQAHACAADVDGLRHLVPLASFFVVAGDARRHGQLEPLGAAAVAALGGVGVGEFAISALHFLAKCADRCDHVGEMLDDGARAGFVRLDEAEGL